MTAAVQNIRSLRGLLNHGQHKNHERADGRSFLAGRKGYGRKPIE